MSEATCRKNANGLKGVKGVKVVKGVKGVKGAKGVKNKAYPRYKPSGVEWLGEVPEHWGVKRFKYSSIVIMGQSPNSDDYSDDPELIPFLQGNADFTDRFPIPRVYCDTANKVAPKGSLLISVRAPVGALNEADQEYGIGRGLCALIPQHKIERQYAWFAIQVTKEELNTLATGSTYDAVSVDEVGNMFLTLPPLPEQQAIATFLDRETGRIDALIAKKQRLLELLAEQRTALISHAVTRGLFDLVQPDDPDFGQWSPLHPSSFVPHPSYKPSGVEWLGEVPGHWSASPLKRIVAIPVTDGPHETPEILDEGIPFVSAEAIRSNKIDFSRKRGFIAESEHRRFCLKYRPKRNDIYMIKSGATTGNLAIVETDEEFSIWSPLAVIRVHKRKADARFVLAAMSSKEFQISVRLFWSFGTQQNIGMNVIENLPIPFPPFSEQQAIAAFLERETAKIDTLSVKVTRAIERLKEYRTALISSVVTGKIDVREAV